MDDLVYSAIFVVFVGLTVGLVAGCARLMPPRTESKP
jgi:hypothetical protein